LRGARYLLQRGAPTRRASEAVGPNNPDEIGIKKKKRKNFKELLTNVIVCSTILIVLNL